jgi:hypothetical protein
MIEHSRRDFNKPNDPEDKRSEDRFQQDLIRDFKRRYHGKAIIHHSPNETKDEIERRRNAAKGVRSGFCDVIILKGKEYLLIELKVNTGRLTDSEITFINEVDAMNGNVAVCWNSEQFWSVVNKFMEK